MRAKASASKRATRKRPRPAHEPKRASIAAESSRPVRRKDQLAKVEVLAAAQQLHEAGSIRVHERLAREAKAERLFWERFAARGETMPPFDGLLEELASDPGGEFLESPSFRDYLGLLIRKRREDYARYSRQSDRVAGALFGKIKGGAPTPFLDVVFDEVKLNRFKAFRDALRRASKEVPARLTKDHEILQDLKSRGFAMRLPAEPSCLPETPLPSSIASEVFVEQQTRTFNEWHLPELARHLSEHRKDQNKRGRMDLSQRAIVWLLETWPKDFRYGPRPTPWRAGPIGERAPIRGTGVDPDEALRELGRLRKNVRRRRNSGDTTG